ncbi:MAG: prolyl oligopeptidase family serine peptidase [Pseudanabaenaceae cyanobacterium SKYGB_i_bin29]|nr:prolyl oligopeptidase family serine peptidase [Pseudanabaenaceae cyanobacterium SKYG29]MDW8421405.1 prolyl oligopeptidase family serine peptidase [Pseudanabaenaceae cyanobacterium SKYGB_i_bin29]
MALVYPPTPADPTVVEDYHGVKVADPYRWLEESDSEATQAWIRAQNELTFGFLAGIPCRHRIRERLTQLWNYERYGLPWREGGRYFFFKNDGLQNQSVLYCQESLTAEPQVVIDPNTLSEDGTVALTGVSVSEDGKWLAYALSRSGSDWQEWRVKNLETLADTDDVVQWSKFSGAAWTKDGRGFFYSRYSAPKDNSLVAANYYQKLYYHVVGTPQEEDRLIYHRPDHKEWGFSGEVTEDGRFLIITVWKGTSPQNLIYYLPLDQDSKLVRPLIEEFVAEYRFLGNEGNNFWFRTDRDAPRGKVVRINIDTKETIDVIPEQAETLEGVNLINNQWVALYLKDACTAVRRYSLEGEPIGEIPLPGLGTATGFGGKRYDRETFYSFTSFTVPPTIYRFDFTTNESTIFQQPQIDFPFGDYTTEEVFYSSKDGTRIPLFLTYRTDLKGKTLPTYLYGYGGFNISLTPSFSISNLLWLELGGLLAIPCLRGGGEYGEEWHRAGQKHNKQNVFDDFMAAAEYLIQAGWTTPQQLAIAGASNGGLLVGACMTQRPDLFAAALPAVGVMDMLRFHKFTIGWAWTEEYGSPDNPDDFPYLYAYSPLHNIKPGTAYPATLVTTADHDDRVVPAHSFKFISALQAAQAGDAPVLIRIETKAGHGAGKPTSKAIEEAADKWAFLVHVLGIECNL